MSQPTTIVLTTLNAKYIHASLGLRYLLANMGELKSQTVLREFTIARRAEEIVSELLLTLDAVPSVAMSLPATPRIIGFGVYIWNVSQTTAVIRLLKARRPEITVVLGGPEVSHELDQQEIVRLADHVITGWGDLSFAELCRAICHGPPPPDKIIAGKQASLDALVLPYREYSDTDLANRLLYVEASRGCPFRCEFCLSALDKTAWSFDLDAFLFEMDRLYRRGARNFKFVDRTFNLKVDASARILQFFLDRLPSHATAGGMAGLFVHFEVVPDHLPDRLKQLISQFPPGVLQFEIGIQSFNVDVQKRISRRQDNEKSAHNLRWLVNESNAHLHTDLIFGLPGETLESFGAGFDRLFRLGPDEIQLGILKRLRGTPIIRHTLDYDMVYEPEPPYAVSQTGAIDAATVKRFARFARYWDMFANSGRFKQSLPLLLSQEASADKQAASPFNAFLGFSDDLWQNTGKTGGLTPEALVDALYDYLTGRLGLPEETVRQSLLADYLASGARGSPRALRGFLPKRHPETGKQRRLAQRQDQHLLAGDLPA